MKKIPLLLFLLASISTYAQDVDLTSGSSLVGKNGTTETQLIHWNGSNAYYGRKLSGMIGVSNHYFRIDGDTKLMINSLGNIGIGTIEPDMKLSIDGGLGLFRNNGSPTSHSMGFIEYEEDGLVFGNKSTIDPLRFQTNSTDRLYIKNDGNVGIGTIEPDMKLSIDGGLGLFRNNGSPTSHSMGYIEYEEDGLVFGNKSTIDPLRFQTNSTDRLYIKNDGNVGIGTTDPDMLLSLNGGLGFFRYNASPTDYSMGYLKYEDGLILGNKSSVDPLRFQTNSIDRMYIKNNGNVGIGTIDPRNKLSVKGSIWAEEVKVSMSDAADWVFEKDYNLTSLEEVESFIEKNKHLPDVPSAADFRENDLNVAQMDNLLLQKLEEMTLYMIDMNKRMKVLEEENNRLQSKVRRRKK